MSDLLDRALAWAREDPDERTRAELEGLIAAAQQDPSGEAAVDLADRFAGRLEFGTAGLRGALGAGPNRMNRVVVTRAAAGLASYLLMHGADSQDTVVVGYDARHDSDVFAEDTAAVMVGAGLQAVLLPRALPTPVLAYAIRHLGCVAGVMVTASHNPPQDNGYKVYLGDGTQIVTPADAEISAEIDAVGALSDVRRSSGWSRLDEAIVESYLRDVVALLDAGGPRELVVVYTPLHGVGGTTVAAAMERAGFGAPHVVPAQEVPDPDFPTVAFPNPEEPGAMDLAMALAAEVDADVVIANDPDADRCAVAVPGPHGWRMLRGDEVGALLGDFLLRSRVRGVFANSIVSSSLLGAVAASYGQPHEETLTGFKWIGRVEGLAFGYEEALGYCVAPGLVRDKDGVSALLRVAELAALLKSQGLTLVDRLDEIARDHGVYATDQLSVRVTDLDRIATIMDRLRSRPPSRLGGLAIEAVDDLSEGSADLPPTDGLRYRLAERARVIVRPSGTEPKVKCYLEVVVPVEGADPAEVAQADPAEVAQADPAHADPAQVADPALVAKADPTQVAKADPAQVAKAEPADPARVAADPADPVYAARIVGAQRLDAIRKDLAALLGA